MMSECDQCVDGGDIRGSWWKYERLYAPDRLPIGLCSAPRDDGIGELNSMIPELTFRGRVECLGLAFEYGCEPDEYR